MILSCPNCTAQFTVDAEKLLPGGRKVRCSKCKHTWFATADGTPALAGAEATAGPDRAEPSGDDDAHAASAGLSGGRGEPEAFEERLRAGRDRRPMVPSETPSAQFPVAGWLVLLLVTGGILVGGWFGRNEIVAQVPQVAGLYDLVGIGVEQPGSGLQVTQVTRNYEVVDGETRLVVKGRVRNTSERTQDVPRLRVALLDANGTMLVDWTFPAAEGQLPAGSETEFATDFPDPPDAARELVVTFAESAS